MEATLGATLSTQPGVAERSFGPGPARPVIRGLDGDRSGPEAADVMGSGVVLAGDVVISLAGVDLVQVKLHALITSVRAEMATEGRVL